MATDPENLYSSHLPDPSLRRESFQREVSRILRFSALALFASFVLVILPQLLTPALLNPSWQLGTINALLGVAVLPPVGVCLLLLAAHLDPYEKLFSKGLTGLRRLATMVGVGYLLLLPLQVSAMVSLSNRAQQAAQAPINSLRRARDQIASSRNPADLQSALQQLPGAPSLPQGFNRPLPQFQKQAIETINRNLSGLEQDYNRRMQALRFADAITLARVGGLLLVLAAVHLQIGGLRPMKSLHRLNHNTMELRQNFRSWKEKQVHARGRRKWRRHH